MDAPDRFAQLLSLTREPFPASRKIHVTGELHPVLSEYSDCRRSGPSIA